MALKQNRSKEVDAYIAEAPEYAHKILQRIRDAFHAGCPVLEERLKWGVPSFEYKGLMGGMAAFKKHVTFGFWKARLMEEYQTAVKGAPPSMMAGRVTTLAELPPKKVLVAFVREARRLNDEGIAEPRPARKKGPIRVTVPADLKTALTRNAKARTAFEALAPSHKREYVEWITEAKREATRVKRVATTLAWLAEGKRRNWKYESR